MKIRFAVSTLFASAVAVMLMSSSSVAADWTQAWVAGSGSCLNVCKSEKARPVTSGIYKNGKPFYVCRSNAHNEGQRAGYNLEPTWSNACVVGWGGKEEFSKPYECLCQR